MLQPWCHETFGITGDRMWDTAYRTWLRGQLRDQLKAISGTSWDRLFEQGKDCPPFFPFMQSTESPPYKPVTDSAVLKVSTHCAPFVQHLDISAQQCQSCDLSAPAKSFCLHVACAMLDLPALADGTKLLEGAQDIKLAPDQARSLGSPGLLSCTIPTA